MNRKITIIGAGSVGSTIAFMCAVKGLAAEIVMIDINEKKALGEAMDIRQGTIFTDPVKIYAGQYPDTANSDIVIITSGLGRKPGQTRLELAQTNVNIMKSIASEITKYAPEAMYIIVSNPVDVLTWVFNKVTDIPERRIIGTGTLLDTSRLCSRLADYLDVSQKNVQAYVLGEHGDSSFVPWSLARIAGVPIADYQNRLVGCDKLTMSLDYENIEQYMRTSGGKIIARKGATFYAIAMSVCHICECVFSDANEVATLSSMTHGEYGIKDVCISLPTILNGKGMSGKLMLPLTDAESAKLRASADVLRGIIDQIEI
ncbi:MAG: L-lactate dehydrogenase [Clostridia bacterium]|nr:L-lactate dehydrogenase [Clostridia bacterium]